LRRFIEIIISDSETKCPGFDSHRSSVVFSGKAPGIKVLQSSYKSRVKMRWSGTPCTRKNGCCKSNCNTL